MTKQLRTRKNLGRQSKKVGTRKNLRRYKGGNNHQFVSYKIKFNATVGVYENNNNSENIDDDILYDFYDAIGESDRWSEYVEAIMENSFGEKGIKNTKIPVKNLKVKLNKESPSKEISGTVSWNSWFIEDEYIKEEAEYRIEDRMAMYGFEDLSNNNSNDYVSVSISIDLISPKK